MKFACMYAVPCFWEAASLTALSAPQDEGAEAVPVSLLAPLPSQARWGGGCTEWPPAVLKCPMSCFWCWIQALSVSQLDQSQRMAVDLDETSVFAGGVCVAGCLLPSRALSAKWFARFPACF